MSRADSPQAKIVQHERLNLDSQFDKKKKQVEVEQKMCVLDQADL